MLYAKVLDGDAYQYPANPVGDHPQTSFSSNWQGGVLGGDEYVVVAEAAQPAFDPATQKIVEGNPAQVSGTWTQQWSIVELTAGEIADRLQVKRESMAVTPYQAYEALAQAGLLDAIEAFMADVNTPANIVRAWNKTTVFHRLSPTVLAVASAMGWTDAQLDGLFTAAAQISP